MDFTLPVPSRLQKLISRPEIQEWFKAHASTATAVTQLEQLELFSRRVGQDPNQILALAKSNQHKLRVLVQNYINEQQNLGRTSNYLIGQWWGIRSFLNYHELAPVSWMPQLSATEVDEDDDLDGGEVVPTTEQMRQILDAQKSARGRATILLLATSGVRIGVLAKQHEADGLRLRQLPELELHPEPHFTKTPFLIRVSSYLAKGSTGTHPRGYVTFATGETASALITYFKERQKKGEELGPDSPVISPDGRGRKSNQVRIAKDGTRFMSRKSLAFSIKPAMNLAAPSGVHWHAHTLRAWFSSKLEQAESQALISRSRRELFMGHSLGTDRPYTVKRKFSPEKIEELRATYERASAYLVLGQDRGIDLDKKRLKLMLLIAGASQEEVDKLDINAMSDKELLEFAKEKMGKTSSGNEVKSTQKAVSASEVDKLLAGGWQYVASLGSDRVILQAPPGVGSDPKGGA